MMFDIDADIIINDLNITRFVISYTRNQNLCNVVHNGEITCDIDLKHFLIRNALEPILPYQDIEIWESGTRVLTGFITTIDLKRSPIPSMSIGFSDTYKKARDYFIDEPDLVTAVDTLPNSIRNLLGLAGLEMELVSSSLNAILIPSGENLSFISVSSAVEQLCAYGNAVIYAGGGGKIKLQKGPKSSDLSFTTSSGIGDGNVFSAVYDESDENSRDIIKVWGQKPYWKHLTSGESPYIVSEQSINLGLPVHKTMLYSSSIIQTQQEADRLSSEIAREVGKINDVYQIECQGNPEISVSKSASLNIQLESLRVTGTAKITSVKTSVSQNGYIMNVTLNEFCPKFAGWALETPPYAVYAGTNKYGVYKSFDRGTNWIAYNEGLPIYIQNVRKIAADETDQVMAIVNGALYKRTPSTVWTAVTLPTPINSSNDDPRLSYNNLVTVDNEYGAFGNFSVLASFGDHPVYSSGIVQGTVRNRTWVYNTNDFGGTWTSTQVHDQDDYNFYGVAMSNKYSTPNILCNKGVEIWANQYGRVILEKYKFNRRMIEVDYLVSSNYHEIPPYDYGITDFSLLSSLNGFTGPSILPSTINFYVTAKAVIPSPPPTTTIYTTATYPTQALLLAQLSTYDNPTFTPMQGTTVETLVATVGKSHLVRRSRTGVYDDPVLGNLIFSSFSVEKKFNPTTTVDLDGDGMSGCMGLSFVVPYQCNARNWYRDCFSGVTTSVVLTPTISNPYLTFDCGTIYWEFY